MPANEKQNRIFENSYYLHMIFTSTIFIQRNYGWMLFSSQYLSDIIKFFISFHWMRGIIVLSSMCNLSWWVRKKMNIKPFFKNSNDLFIAPEVNLNLLSLCDFERTINLFSFKNWISSIKIVGCYFHLVKNWWQYVSE